MHWKDSGTSTTRRTTHCLESPTTAESPQPPHHLTHPRAIGGIHIPTAPLLFPIHPLPHATPLHAPPRQLLPVMSIPFVVTADAAARCPIGHRKKCFGFAEGVSLQPPILAPQTAALRVGMVVEGVF